jgi:hypothetical protein
VPLDGAVADEQLLEGLTAEAVAGAHQKDLETQGKYGVEYRKYWFDESSGVASASSTLPTPHRTAASAALHRARETSWWTSMNRGGLGVEPFVTAWWSGQPNCAATSASRVSSGLPSRSTRITHLFVNSASSSPSVRCMISVPLVAAMPATEASSVRRASV